jgi:hypothetical protein
LALICPLSYWLKSRSWHFKKPFKLPWHPWADPSATLDKLALFYHRKRRVLLYLIQVQFNIKLGRFFLVYVVLAAMLSFLQMFFHRAYMFSYYERLPDWFLLGDNIALPFLVLAACVHAFLFLLLYAQCAKLFPDLRGGLMFGIIQALLVFLPFSLVQMAVVDVNDLRPVLGQWMNFGFFSNIILGAICGSLYKA